MEVVAQILHKGLLNNSYIISEGKSVEAVADSYKESIGDIADITISPFSYKGHAIDMIIDYH